MALIGELGSVSSDVYTSRDGFLWAYIGNANRRKRLCHPVCFFRLCLLGRGSASDVLLRRVHESSGYLILPVRLTSAYRTVWVSHCLLVSLL